MDASNVGQCAAEDEEEEDVDPCDAEPCANGGRCSADGRAYQCDCQREFR